MKHREEIVAALVREIQLQSHYLEGEDIRTVYFGGGTPSLLSAGEIAVLLQSISKYLALSRDPEITLEANPDDLSKEKLQQLKMTGINRLSIGIQSFDEDILKALNRAHDGGMARRCIQDAQDVGFENISADLIYAVPTMDNSRWEKNILSMITLQPQHISSYALTVEEKTAFGRWASQGKFVAVSEDTAATQLEMLVDRLAAHDYIQYEVSNFSISGFQSKHNSNYWREEKYLGIGPSAHSYNGISRQYNVLNNAQYIRAISEGVVPATLETLSTADKINEYLLTTLRTSWGSDLAKIRSRYAHDLLAENETYLQLLEKHKLAVIEKGILRLTRSGLLQADKIASDLFVSPRN